MKKTRIQKLKEQFRSWMTELYPNFNDNFSFHRDEEMRKWEFMAKLEEQIEICAKEQSCSTCKEFLGLNVPKYYRDI